MWVIEKMRVENFFSFGEAEIDFERAGFVLVEGSNGSGKSTIADALLWCLFGETTRGYKHDEVVHRKVGKGCVVTVCFKDGDDEYQVTRARKHPKLRNSLLLSHNGGDVSGVAEKETQAMIERALGCSYKTFLSSVVFGQDRTYRFSSLTDAEQKKVLDEVLGVERFAAACATARRQVSDLQTKLASERRNLERSEEARDAAEVEATNLQTRHDHFEASQQEKLETEREKLRAVKEQLGVNRKVTDANKLKADVDAALKTLAACEKKLDKWTGSAATAREAVVGSKAKLDASSADADKHKFGKTSSHCPTCGQRVAQKDLEERHVAASAAVSLLKKEHTSWVKIADEAAATLISCKQEVKAARQAMTDAQKALNDGISLDAAAATRRRQRDDYVARIVELEAEVSPYGELAVKASERHYRYGEEASGFAGLIKEHEEQIQRAEFWVKAFGNAGLRSLLVDTSLPLLNEEAARVSRVLTNGAIAIEFSAVSEQKSGKVVDRFEVRVDNAAGAGDYAGNSSGERAKVDLCVGLALQRLVASRSSSSFNLAIFDEAFDHLDQAAHEPVVEVLSELDKESVLVISHDEDLKAWFPAVWSVTKRKGFSSVDT